MDLHYDVPLSLFACLLIALLIVVAEWGRRVGQRSAPGYGEGARDFVKLITGVVLSLLTLLLSFSLSAAIGRYDARRMALVAEANALRSAYLQGSLLPVPRAGEATRLLRSYVDVRDELYAAGSNESALNEAVARADDIHLKLWRLQGEQARAWPDALATRQFGEALTALMESNASRLSQLQHRLPTPLFLLLVLVSVFAAYLTGFGRGLGRSQHSRAQMLLLALITVIVGAILDSDRPRDGLITVPDDAMRSVEYLMDRVGS